MALNPDVQVLRDEYLLPYVGGARQLYTYYLGRYLDWCDVQAYEPLTVTRADIERYVHHLQLDSGTMTNCEQGKCQREAPHPPFRRDLDRGRSAHRDRVQQFPDSRAPPAESGEAQNDGVHRTCPIGHPGVCHQRAHHGGLGG
ncbi:hypothetical protein [Terrabacter sp. 2YAF2]|uniref:hypothetical protein n=1 Tax=Terrabacter sp. 2YAF2 TaxID=3233026 RepID=UPI003F96784F